MEKGMIYLSGLDLGHNFVKAFEDLATEYDVPLKDRRKYNSLINWILLDWFYNPKQNVENIFDTLVSELLQLD